MRPVNGNKYLEADEVKVKWRKESGRVQQKKVEDRQLSIDRELKKPKRKRERERLIIIAIIIEI